MLTKERKAEVIRQFGSSSHDSGGTAVQIVLISERINQVAGHLKKFPKDKHSRQGLLKLVGQKRRLSNYLKRSSMSRYLEVMQHVKN